jgi:uncharacterized membrane protein YedE/YeeE
MIEWLSQPWPWYVSGPILGLMVPALLLWGNKPFGISSSLQDLCAIAPGARKVQYFDFDWKEKSWRLFLILGVIIGGAIGVFLLDGGQGPAISPEARAMFLSWNLPDASGIGMGLAPDRIFALENLFTPLALISLVLGGFLVGFGTRYANGCTSGHAIMGLSLFNVGSLVAVLGFFAGGLLVSHFVMPWLMSL